MTHTRRFGRRFCAIVHVSKNSGTTESLANQPLRNISFSPDDVLTIAQVLLRRIVKRRRNSRKGGLARRRNSTFSPLAVLYRSIARLIADVFIWSEARTEETPIHFTFRHIHSSSAGQVHHRQSTDATLMVKTIMNPVARRISISFQQRPNLRRLGSCPA